MARDHRGYRFDTDTEYSKDELEFEELEPIERFRKKPKTTRDAKRDRQQHRKEKFNFFS